MLVPSKQARAVGAADGVLRVGSILIGRELKAEGARARCLSMDDLRELARMRGCQRRLAGNGEIRQAVDLQPRLLLDEH